MSDALIDSDKTLAKVIKLRRKELGLTQKELAKYCKLSHNGLSQIEQGEKSIRLSTLLRLSKMLGFSVKLHMEEP